LTARNVDLVAEGYDLALRGGNMRDASLIVRRARLPETAGRRVNFRI
jgi:hypothetical protein